jgi:hypothetical protein
MAHADGPNLPIDAEGLHIRLTRSTRAFKPQLTQTRTSFERPNLL